MRAHALGPSWRASIIFAITFAFAIGGCSESHSSSDAGVPGFDAFVPERDAFVPERDAFVPERDAFVAPEDDAAIPAEDAFVSPEDDAGSDAGPPEPCSPPGTLETVGCGRCGARERFCAAPGIWEYGPCQEPTGAECAPGETSMIACGMCGLETLRCGTTCTWMPSGGCRGERGECMPGASERDTTGCMLDHVRSRRCGEDCGWGPYDACVPLPNDLDGDGARREVDCDDTDPDVRPGTSRPCGSFACEIAPGLFENRAGTSRCAGPGWELCERAADCVEGAMCETFFGEEVRDCAWTGCLPAPVQRRTCDASGVYGRWSACDASGAGAATRPAECATYTEAACGACGEGVEYTTCDASCTMRTGPCLGRGCVPGTIRRTSDGCPAGTYRGASCGTSCMPTMSGPCFAPAPEVDVMIVVDNTGSHTDFVASNAAALANELAMPLLGDVDVRVGVASYADFPISPYGVPPDEPFAGILIPTRAIGDVQAALSGIPSRSGGDGPESGLEALHALLGGGPIPKSAVPFRCPVGTSPGGCWRAIARRAIVIVTDATSHNAPSSGGVIVSPYDARPRAVGWASTRALFGPETRLFALVPADSSSDLELSAEAQMNYLVSDLGQTPADSIVTYPAGTFDVSAEIRVLATLVSDWVSSP